jgi:hypothetical protein
MGVVEKGGWGEVVRYEIALERRCWGRLSYTKLHRIRERWEMDWIGLYKVCQNSMSLVH